LDKIDIFIGLNLPNPVEIMQNQCKSDGCCRIYAAAELECIDYQSAYKCREQIENPLVFFGEKKQDKQDEMRRIGPHMPDIVIPEILEEQTDYPP